MFSADDYVRCFDLSTKKGFKQALKAFNRELPKNKIENEKELNDIVADLKREKLIGKGKECWVGLADRKRPGGRSFVNEMTIVSFCGAPTRYYETKCEVLVRERDAAVFAKPDDLY